MPRRDALQEELEALELAAAEPPPEDRQARLEKALASKRAPVVARAAQIASEASLDSLEDELVAAYDRLVPGGAKADPGCRAKTALLTALDHLERNDEEPFLSATRYVQLERAFGAPPDDTAIHCRARGVLALVRMRHADALLVLGRALGDSEPAVRENAAKAIGEHGDRNGAGLLLSHLGRGEAHPEVLATCVTSLVRLAPDYAPPVVEPHFEDPELVELVAHAVVSADSDAANQILVDGLRDRVLLDERMPLLKALAVSRRDSARTLLLGRIREGGRAEAEASVRALALHKYDPRLVEAVHEAVRANGEDALAAAFESAFGEAL